MHDLVGLPVRLQRPAAIAQHSGPGSIDPYQLAGTSAGVTVEGSFILDAGANTMSGNNTSATGVDGGWPKWQVFGYNLFSFNAGGGSGQRGNLAIESNVAGASTGPGQLYSSMDGTGGWVGNNNNMTGLQVVPGTWYSYALELNSNMALDSLYVSTSASTTPTGGNLGLTGTFTSAAATGAMIIGNSNEGANTFDDVNFFPGSIGGIKIWNEMRSPSDAFSDIWAVPEPLSLVLLVGGLAGLLAYAWRKRK